MIRSISTFTLLFALVTNAPCVCAQENGDANQDQVRPLVLAHYMPWYSAMPKSSRWGWHWTMNAFDPEIVSDAKREIASHFHPLIGPYDSGDEDVLEYQLLTMKLAGIDGVIVDWYGLSDLHDYAALHRNTLLLVKQSQRLKMKFAICYEDQTIEALQKAGRITAKQRVAHVAKEINWLADNWFKSDQYVRYKDQPLLLSFGFDGLNNNEWTECLNESSVKVTYISQHRPRAAADGAFDWPSPVNGLKAAKDFCKQQTNWPIAVPVAFPRFVDIYSQAKVRDSYGRIEDNGGATFRETLTQSLKTNRPVVQIATWNDWGEGTQIEPSHEYGYRDLETILKLCAADPRRKFEHQATDLRLPARLLELRRSQKGDKQKRQLDRIARLLADRDSSQASELIDSLARP